MNIPEQVKNEARVLIEQYGDTFEYLGIYEGQEAYVFKFPGDSCTGYPSSICMTVKTRPK